MQKVHKIRRQTSDKQQTNIDKTKENKINNQIR